MTIIWWVVMLWLMVIIWYNFGFYNILNNDNNMMKIQVKELRWKLRYDHFFKCVTSIHSNRISMTLGIDVINIFSFFIYFCNNNGFNNKLGKECSIFFNFSLFHLYSKSFRPRCVKIRLTFFFFFSFLNLK